MIALIGWLGTIAYTIYGIPQVILCIKNGNALGVSKLFAATYLCGCICSLIYALYYHDAVLTLNFAVGTISWLVINKYIYFARK